MADDITKIIREGVKDQLSFFKDQGAKWLNTAKLPLDERTQIYSDYLKESIKFNQKYYNELSNYAPKDDFEDFAKCLETRRVRNALNDTKESLSRNINYLSDNIHPEKEREVFLHKVTLHVLKSAASVVNLDDQNAFQQHMAYIKKSYARDDIRMQIQNECGNLSKFVTYNSAENNNSVLNNESLSRIAANFNVR